MFGKRTRGADKLLLSIVAALVIVEEGKGAVSKVEPDFDPILSLSPVGLTRSPG